MPKQYRGAFTPESWHDENLPQDGDVPHATPAQRADLHLWETGFRAVAYRLNRSHARVQCKKCVTAALAAAGITKGEGDGN